MAEVVRLVASNKKKPVGLRDLEPDEPYFVLRGRDVIAFPLVAAWIQWATRAGVNKRKIAEAKRVFVAMRDHPDKRLPD